jgi:hypothetical protein
MKILIACLALLIMANSVQSQTTNTTPTTKQDYLKRSKSQKTAAWLFLAGGGTLIVLGSKDVDNKLGNSEGTRSTAAIVAGIGCVSVSTVLFIASARNKKKGESMALDFKMEKAPVLQQRGLAYTSYPALTLRLKL